VIEARVAFFPLHMMVFHVSSMAMFIVSLLTAQQIGPTAAGKRLEKDERKRSVKNMFLNDMYSSNRFKGSTRVLLIFGQGAIKKRRFHVLYRLLGH